MSGCTEKMLFFVEKFFFTSFAILFGSAISFCSASSFSDLVVNDKSTWNSVSPDDDFKSQTYKYVFKSYFEKYVSPDDDTEFQDFGMNGRPFSSCEVIINKTFTPRINIEERYLIRMGSHRRLFSSVNVDASSKLSHLLPQHSCQLLFIERLPLGLFADEFELQHHFHLGVFEGVLVSGDTNIELPTIKSNRCVIEIQMDLGSNFLGVSGVRRVDMAVPLHARYPPLDESGYARVEIGAPDLLLCCCVQMKLRNQSCCMQPVVSNHGDNRKMVWVVPCGKRSHSSFVYYLTYFSSFVSAIIISVTAIIQTFKENEAGLGMKVE